MKDNFSRDSASYARFRPTYPQQLVDDLVALVPNRERAWDCATGTGQFAKQLAAYFQEVEASDMSGAQIAQAVQVPNINYRVETAEAPTYPDNHFDLVTVAQGIHWFLFDAFYESVDRVLRPGGVLAAIGYGLLDVGEDLYPLLFRFYDEVVGPYWDPERRYLDERLETIPFPYPEIPFTAPPMEFEWDVETFLGYLGTWSAAFHYRRRTNHDPIIEIAPLFREAWGERRRVRFPLFVRVGRKPA